MLVHIVADYGGGDLAFAEVAQRFASLLPGRGRVEWLELFLRGGNASEAFGRPEPGAEVHIRPQP